MGNLQGITQNFPVAKWEGMSSKCLDERDEGCFLYIETAVWAFVFVSLIFESSDFTV